MAYDFMIAVEGREAVPFSGAYEADAEGKAALIERFGLASLDLYRFDYELKAGPRGWVLTAHLVAKAEQPCVATLEPVPQAVDTRFQVRFVPEDSPELDAPIDEEAFHDPDAEDIDVMVGRSVPVGETAAQYFSLALDPFPRSPRADEIIAGGGGLVITEEEDVKQRSPFAVLGGKKDDAGKA